MTRILVATPLYPPDVGGPATYTKLLERELPARGISVSVESLNRVRAPFGIKHLIYFFRLLFSVRNAHIIYAQDPLGAGLPALVAARLAGKKFLLKIVGDRAWEEYMQASPNADLLDTFQDKRYGPGTELRRVIQKFVARHAVRIVVPSEYLKKILVSGWGISEARISVIYNAFEPSKNKWTREEARRELGLSGTVLVSAGRLVSWKGFSVLVRSMPEILKEVSDAKLYIVGSGPERKNIESAISHFGLDQHIFLKGQTSHGKMLQHLKAADVFVLNTGYEGLSHMLLEAMALGVPVVTTHSGGNPELIEDGVQGRLVAYNNKEALTNSVLELLHDRETAQRMSAAAQTKAREFSKEKMLEELVTLFKNL